MYGATYIFRLYVVHIRKALIWYDRYSTTNRSTQYNLAWKRPKAYFSHMYCMYVAWIASISSIFPFSARLNCLRLDRSLGYLFSFFWALRRPPLCLLPRLIFVRIPPPPLLVAAPRLLALFLLFYFIPHFPHTIRSHSLHASNVSEYWAQYTDYAYCSNCF